MLYRNIRKIATGEWVNVLWTTEGDSFDVAASVHVATTATVLSLDASELEAIDGSSDAKTGTLIEQPAPPLTRQQALMAIGKDNWTDAQQKELIDLLARHKEDHA